MGTEKPSASACTAVSFEWKVGLSIVATTLRRMEFVLGYWPTMWLILGLIVRAASPAEAADWPGFLGPLRNGHAPDLQLADQLGESFKVRLAHPLGAGYAGPAIVGDRVVVFHRIADVERLEALDRHTGRSLWQVDQPAQYEGGYNPDNGPRAVPCIADGQVIAWGASGRLLCVSLQNGQLLWSRHLAKEYQAPEGYFGFGCAPMVLGDKVFVTLGGRPQAGIVALDRKSGQTVWTATSEGVSYASSTFFNYNGRRVGLFLTRLHLLAIELDTGQLLFQHPFGRSGLTVTGATPIVADNQIFLTASYNIGATVLKVTLPTRVEPVWASDEVLSSQYTTPVYHNGYLYGTHGREDSPTPAELRCVEFQTGRVCWRKPGVGVAHVLMVGDKLLVVEVQHGDAVLVRADPERYVELDRRHVTDATLRAPPAIAHGELFLRSWRSETSGELLVLPLPVKPK